MDRDSQNIHSRLLSLLLAPTETIELPESYIQSAEDIAKHIVTELNEYRQSERPLDDVTLVVLKRL